MARRKERTFGQVIRERRRQLDLTQQEVAERIRTSTPYVGHLEFGKRHPSHKVLSRLADVRTAWTSSVRETAQKSAMPCTVALARRSVPLAGLPLASFAGQ